MLFQIGNFDLILAISSIKVIKIRILSLQQVINLLFDKFSSLGKTDLITIIRVNNIVFRLNETRLLIV
jgi:hypothetical protein